MRGFYLAETEDNYYRGNPIRVCFFGKFIGEDETQFFDVYIYPRIGEIIFLIGAFFRCIVVRQCNNFGICNSGCMHLRKGLLRYDRTVQKNVQ